MSVKKDRFNKRKHRNAKGSFWTVPKWYTKMHDRVRKAKNRQLMRNGIYDNFERFRKDAGYSWW